MPVYLPPRELSLGVYQGNHVEIETRPQAVDDDEGVEVKEKILVAEPGAPVERLEAIVGQHKYEGAQESRAGVFAVKEQDNAEDEALHSPKQDKEIKPVERELHSVVTSTLRQNAYRKYTISIKKPYGNYPRGLFRLYS